MTADPLIESLLAAVTANPDDVHLRAHLAGLLADAGRTDEAVVHASHALTRDPAHAEARAVLRRLVAGESPTGPTEAPPEAAAVDERFDWSAAEEEVAGIVEPAFVEPDAHDATDEIDVGATPGPRRPSVTLADVGGLEHVKELVELTFLGPLRQPELRRLFGASMRGGVLLYGPPGCGKSFFAEALAGELGSAWMSIRLHDVLDMWLGSSERNLHELFRRARAAAPCVVFVDEIDALGQRRTNLRHSAMRTTVNQFLAELDGEGADNDGVFLVGATNHPWDVDAALRRPGRFGQLVFVPPPDDAARRAILRSHLADRPIEGIDLELGARLTAGFSGADIAHVCDRAAERALAESVRSGTPRMVSMEHLEAAIAETRPSTGAWFDVARNVVEFANEGGLYDDLRDHMRRERLL